MVPPGILKTAFWVTAVCTLVSIGIRSGQAKCLDSQSKKYSAAVKKANRSVPGIGGPARAVKAGVSIGTAIGQLVNSGLSKWWDPVLEVFPDDPTNLVDDIGDAAILALADDMLGYFPNTPGPVTLADLQALNSFSPGFGDAATSVLTTGVRAFYHTAQGAAAYAQTGVGSAAVLDAATRLNSDLLAYRDSMTAFASYLDDSMFPAFVPFVVGDFTAFLAAVQGGGAGALPQGEIELGNRILQMAHVHMGSTSLGDSVAAFVAAGDTGNEAASWPTGGYSLSETITSGLPTFNVDCLDCDIATPEPQTLYLSGGAFLFLLGIAAARHRCGRSRPA